MDKTPKIEKLRLTNDFFLSFNGGWGGGVAFSKMMINNGIFRLIWALT